MSLEFRKIHRKTPESESLFNKLKKRHGHSETFTGTFLYRTHSVPTSERNFTKGNAKEWKCGSYKLLRDFTDRCDWIKPSTTLRRRISAKWDFSYRIFIVRDLYIEKIRVLLRQSEVWEINLRWLESCAMVDLD